MKPSGLFWVVTDRPVGLFAPHEKSHGPARNPDHPCRAARDGLPTLLPQRKRSSRLARGQPCLRDVRPGRLPVHTAFREYGVAIQGAGSFEFLQGTERRS